MPFCCWRAVLVEGLLKLTKLWAAAETVNLGNPTEFTIGELARLVIELCGSKSEVKFYPLPQDDPKQRKPVIARAERLLNWTPHIPLREGLQHTISYFAGRIKREEHDSANPQS